MVAVLNSNRVRSSSGVCQILRQAPIECHQIAVQFFNNLDIVWFICIYLLTPENRKLAEAKAKVIESDISYERFDSTLARYKPQNTNNYASVSK